MIYYISEQMEFDNIIKETLNDINTICLEINDEYISESVSIKSIAIKIKDFFMKIFNKFIDFLRNLFKSAKITMIRKRIKDTINKYSKRFNLNISIEESYNDDDYQQLSLFNTEVHVRYSLVSRKLLDDYMNEMQTRYDTAFTDKDKTVPDYIDIEGRLSEHDYTIRDLVEKIRRLKIIDKSIQDQLEKYPDMLFDRKDDIERKIVDKIIKESNQDYLEAYNDSSSKASKTLTKDMNYLIDIFGQSTDELIKAAIKILDSIDSDEIKTRMDQYKSRVNDKISIEDRRRELARTNK